MMNIILAVKMTRAQRGQPFDDIHTSDECPLGPGLKDLHLAPSPVSSLPKKVKQDTCLWEQMS